MKNDFNYCPNCTSQKIKNIDNIKWFCKDCGFELYSNTATAVGVIITDNEKNVLFEVRAKEPRKGFLCLPGGFVNHDEKAEDAIIRECQEEMGITIQKPKFLCTNPNTYLYKKIEYKTCDIFFTAKIPDEYQTIEQFIKNLTPEQNEVQNFVTYKIKTIEDIEKLPLAFESAKETLKEYIGISKNTD